MLAPMQLELAPLVRLLALEADDAVHRGRAGEVEVVAMLTNIGMTAGAQAARRMLEQGVDWMMVVGIAGGVDHSLAIGDVIMPDVVLDRASGNTYVPSGTGGLAARGTLSCGDDLITDPGKIAAMARDGVVAVDMETAAVAAVCEDTGCAWSVFRGISDFADEGLVDDDLFAMTRPDGTSDPDVIKRYLEEHPEKLDVLMRLGAETQKATNAAAAAAIAACAAV